LNCSKDEILVSLEQVAVVLADRKEKQQLFSIEKQIIK